MSQLSLCFSDSGPRKFKTLTGSHNKMCVRKSKIKPNKQTKKQTKNNFLVTEKLKTKSDRRWSNFRF